MKSAGIIEALGALAHEHRLKIFRMLVERGTEGMAAGQIAQRLGLAPSSLTFHLQNLQRAHLISQRRESRQLIYAADYAAMTDLIGYLTENCCTEGECSPACAPRAPRRVKRVAEMA